MGLQMTLRNSIPEDIKLKYIERRKNDLTHCRQALADLNFQYLASIGHQIKGNASSFGYDELSLIAIEMEELALKMDAQNLISTLDRFENYLKDL
jgi:HPt (histidine-containing phosphotransfer) domain-containing protein